MTTWELRVVLIDHRAEVSYDLGALPTDNLNLDDPTNQGRVVKLLRRHPIPIRAADVQLLVYLDGDQLGQPWRGRTILGLLPPTSEKPP